MKYVEEYLKDVIKVKPLGDLTTKNDELNGMSGEMVYVGGKCSDIFISHADYANWLEKQGESSIYNVPSREVILAIWDLGNEWKELTNYSISTEHGTQLDYIQKHWEESEYYLRKKQGEKKPADKVEPKFHEGEWVIDSQGLTHKIERVIENVTNHTYGYDIVGGGYFNDNTEGVRPWTIQDAKDGDVLVTENFIFIFKNIDNGNGVHYYCQYEISKHEDDNQFDIALPQSLMGRVGNSISHYSPATKEQRDTLMKGMADAGYTFDFEKKELKELAHQEVTKTSDQETSAWSEDDSRKIETLLSIIFDYAFYKDALDENKDLTGEYAELSDWLQFFPERFNLQPKQEWSEEDEKMLNSFLHKVEVCDLLTNKEDVWITKKLKSVRPQQWKPSNEQITELCRVISGCSYDIEPLAEMAEQLKKLKEE